MPEKCGREQTNKGGESAALGVAKGTSGPEHARCHWSRSWEA